MNWAWVFSSINWLLGIYVINIVLLRRFSQILKHNLTAIVCFLSSSRLQVPIFVQFVKNQHCLFLASVGCYAKHVVAMETLCIFFCKNRIRFCVTFVLQYKLNYIFFYNIDRYKVTIFVLFVQNCFRNSIMPTINIQLFTQFHFFFELYDSHHISGPYFIIHISGFF